MGANFISLRRELAGQSDEVILAQEQGVIRRGVGAKKALEGDFGVGEVEGTLVLTNQRLLFVCGNEEEVELPEPTGFNPFGKVTVLFSDVEDLRSVPENPRNLSIDIAAISSLKGRRGELAKPALEVGWREGGSARSFEFIQQLTGKRARNLNDWAAVIERLKAGKQQVVRLPPSPSLDTLEGKVMSVMGDMQEKGEFEIEGEVERGFKVDLDPDQVEESCGKLVSMGLLDVREDVGGDKFYQKRSSLGQDDLSS